MWALPTTQELVSHAKAAVPRCLIPAQRNSFFLPPEPPLWCIELEKWPYDTTAWKQWLNDSRAGTIDRAQRMQKLRLIHRA